MSLLLAPPAPERQLASSGRVRFAAGLARHGHRTALVDADRTVSYLQLAEAVAAASRTLDDPADPRRRRLVLVALDRSIEAVTTYLATLASGHVALLAPESDAAAVRTLMTTYHPDVVARRVDGRWTVTSRRPASAHQLHDELAALLSTSGSTGSPKLVRLSGANLQANADSIIDALGISPDDRAVTTLPLTYSYGLSVLHSHLEVGASVLLTDRSVVDAEFWDAVATHAVTTLPGVPHTFDLLDRVGFAHQHLPSLAHVTVAGGRLAPEVVRRFAALGERMGFELHVMYGQTEATARIATLDPSLASTAPDAIGTPIPGGTIDLVPVADAGDGAVGEIVYRGPNVMMGYATSPADLAQGRTVDALHTGDLATRDADGLLRIVGRTSRLAKVFGLRIDLDRVEHLLHLDGISAVVTASSAGLDAVAEGRVDAERVASLAAQASGLPRHAVRARVVDALPWLPNGKPDRAAAAELAEGAEPCAALVAAPAAVTTEQLTALYAELLGRPDAQPDDSFVSLGGDSLSFVEVSVRLEQLLGDLPCGWHTMSPRQLATHARPAASTSARTATVETGVVLRAVAIVAIVGSHIGAFTLVGGAHVLLALAGFATARFLLDRDAACTPSKRLLRGAARVAVPSAIWIAAVAALTGAYSWANIALVNTFVGPQEFGPGWHFWFVEALVAFLVVTAVVFAIPGVAGLERRHPFVFPALLVAAGLAVRFGVMPGFIDPRPLPASGFYFFWFFALGWWAARASVRWQRVTVTAVVLAAVPGYWDDPAREIAVIIGLVLLIWAPTLRVPRPSVPLLTKLAAASLAIYLTHWVVFPPLQQWPLVALAASLAAGVLAYEAARLAMKAAKSLSFWSAYASPYSTRARSSRSPVPM